MNYFLFWTFNISTVLIIFAGLLFVLAPRLPQFLQDLLLYGKVRGERRDSTFVQRFLEVPKRWFVYFYIHGVVTTSLILCALSQFILIPNPKGNVSNGFLSAFKKLQSFNSSDAFSSDVLGPAIMVLTVFLHLSRRSLECIFVSVYSSGTMNLLHFLIGFFLYSTLAVSALLGIRDLPSAMHGFAPNWEDFSWSQIIGLFMFTVASFWHHKSHVILASLRTNKSLVEGRNSPASERHFIPRNGLFELVSCPHYFAEILIYTGWLLLLKSTLSTPFLPIWVFVVSNQLLAGYLTHRWYLQNFPSYPKTRKAIIPFIF